jgi:thiosulfate dehydrogenase [quinone] large subunit
MTRFQATALVALRLLVGWHLCYEGIAKLLNPYWTSANYLSAAQWLFKERFIALSASPAALAVVDALNAWGLTLIGLGLLVGLLTRTATVAGIVLLALYYVVAPPLIGTASPVPAEGSYLIVNKVLVEIAALAVLLAFPTGRTHGLDRLLSRGAAPAAAVPAAAGKEPA